MSSTIPAMAKAKSRRARGLTDGLVQLPVGIEDVDDVIAGPEQAPAKARFRDAGGAAGIDHPAT